MNNTFEDFKNKISITQVAMDIGYIIKPKSSRIKPELALYDSAGTKLDEIVVCNSGGAQTYFSRAYEKGNLINFVFNRLDKFGYSGSGYNGVNEVLSKYLNGSAAIQSVPNAAVVNSTFELERYILIAATTANMQYLQAKRKISANTVHLFSPFIFLIKDKEGSYYNVGFPFRVPGTSEILNFEIRNEGYKSFATGGNRSTAVFTFCLNNNHDEVKQLYFFESTIDLMSFVELNIEKLDLNSSAFISTGGHVCKQQIKLNVIEFKNAHLNFCYDNDASGAVFDVLAYSYANDIEIKAYKVKDTIVVIHDGNKEEYNVADFEIQKYCKLDNFSICKPKNKDWNEDLGNRK